MDELLEDGILVHVYLYLLYLMYVIMYVMYVI